MIENPAQVNSIDFKTFESEAGKFTVADIREELLKPGRDPRDKFVVPKFREDVKEIARPEGRHGTRRDGDECDELRRVCRSWCPSGRPGHISELSHKYVQDARQAVKVGDIVKVKVIGVDPR